MYEPPVTEKEMEEVLPPDNLRKLWVLMDPNVSSAPRYVEEWLYGRGPSYTSELERAQIFSTFQQAMTTLISRTYLSGKAHQTYNTALVPAQIKEVSRYKAVLAYEIIEKFEARWHDTKKWEPLGMSSK